MVLTAISLYHRSVYFNRKEGLIPRSSAAKQANTEQSEAGLLIPRSMLRGRSFLTVNSNQMFLFKELYLLHLLLKMITWQ